MTCTFSHSLTRLARTVLLTLALTSVPAQTQQQHLHTHTYTDSFPTYEEYDYSILDPRSAYGSPYGGFSRATASRLAALPLPLPPVPEETPSDDHFYMNLRDYRGRLYACRVYHEDELDPTSLMSSMFDAPVLRSVPDNNQSDEEAAAAAAEKASKNGKGKAEKDGDEMDDDETLIESKLQVDSQGEVSKLKEKGGKGTEVYLDLFKLMSQDTGIRALQGHCGHIHLGWWSYEWCFESHVSQFHIDFDINTEELQITDITNLGKFASRQVITKLDREEPNDLAEDLTEIARIEDSHVGGDVCDATGKPRTTKVRMLCCSDEILATRRGKVQKKDSSLAAESKIAAIHSVEEDPNAVCSYVVTVCTSLLCEHEEDAVDATDAKSGTNKNAARKAAAKPKEDESVREILERTLGDVCLQSGTGGWWTYEICHGKGIRQYHEVIGSHKSQSGATYTSRVVESEHFLGWFIPEDSENIYPNEDEWKHVVNVTDSAKGEGNGAYFEIEYTAGDICDNSDVTDAAVIAGATGKGGSIARASSVRYFCGSAYDISVSEDSTCHYIVEVKVPDLCVHPLFKAPVSKQQVVKCLPVEDDDDWL